MLILDEIQTGFYRTGTPFVYTNDMIVPDIITMAKGIANGFPFGAVALTTKIASKVEHGDHGGTYSGNPLGCAIAASVVDYMITKDIGKHVKNCSELLFTILENIRESFPEYIIDIRGIGLLMALEFSNESVASFVNDHCLQMGLVLNLKHGTIVRIFPALTITEEELVCGVAKIHTALKEFSSNL